MAVATTGISIEEFFDGDFPQGAWLIDGEVVVNDPTIWHNLVASRIVRALGDWCGRGSDRGLAAYGGNWTVGPGQVLKPDAWWVSKERLPDIDAPRNDAPPDIAVEVRSPGTWHYDIGRKRAIYEQAGVAELWLVDPPPGGVVMVLRRSDPETRTFDLDAEYGPGDALVTPLLDGFSLAIDDLFDR